MLNWAPQLTIVTPAELCIDDDWCTDSNIVLAVVHSLSASLPNFQEILSDGMSRRSDLLDYTESRSNNSLLPQLLISFESATLKFLPLLIDGATQGTRWRSAEQLLLSEGADVVFTPILEVSDGCGITAVVVTPSASNADDNSVEPFTRAEIIVRLYYSGLIVAEHILQAELSSMWSDHTQAETALMFQRIFASYAREDKCAVESVASVVRSLGVAELRWDLEVLHPGDNWQAVLIQEIESADSFQLFWSEYAKRSRNVRAEWMHAMSLERARFVKPVYWNEPMPQPPRELRSIHFSRICLSS